MWLLPVALAAQEITLDAADEVVVGASVEVRWQGGDNARDFITIVPVDTAVGKYEAYQYAGKSPVSLVAPPLPGQYEIRYLAAASPYATLQKRLLTVVDVTATLDAADTIASGDELSVTWTGPDNKQDFITLVPAGTAEGQYAVYTYTSKGSPLTLRVPDATGDYELRYLMGSGNYRTLGRRAVSVTGTEATLDAPDSIAAGSPIEIG
jgi:Ca-activated chloride channel family protein